MDVWTWKPRGTSTPTNQALNTRVEFINGNEQVQQNAVNNKLTFQCTFKDKLTAIERMKKFFDAHCHGEVFYFTDEYGERQTVRFADDSFAPKITWGFTGEGSGLTAVGGEVTLTFRRVIV